MPEPQPPIETATWYEVVLKQKYNDPQKLKSSLDSMYGQGRYKVKIKASRYILQLPEPPHEDRIAEIERTISFHYKED
ncbi:uncharacterized protein F4817DRAFT_294798 [Daldinia loculata]|uniref:uncharacterized protein n=1 Tax=Daldinia loculata TaxID=103429 RepID=UPI0020C4A13E|nr:uncharacterized protein F4817DRAFT_294798 [Daldinia loculata]KAI1642504.1 hypothetical protein F4817DRAFT_294798 [Daldinia loculata]